MLFCDWKERFYLLPSFFLNLFTSASKSSTFDSKPSTFSSSSAFLSSIFVFVDASSCCDNSEPFIEARDVSLREGRVACCCGGDDAAGSFSLALKFVLTLLYFDMRLDGLSLFEAPDTLGARLKGKASSNVSTPRTDSLCTASSRSSSSLVSASSFSRIRYLVSHGNNAQTKMSLQVVPALWPKFSPFQRGE